MLLELGLGWDALLIAVVALVGHLFIYIIKIINFGQRQNSKQSILIIYMCTRVEKPEMISLLSTVESFLCILSL